MNPLPIGRCVTVTLSYDGGRDVTVYLPPVDPRAVVYTGDGQTVPGWGSLLEGSGCADVMIVGTHRVPDEAERIREYSPGVSSSEFAFDPVRFAAHEAFFTGEVRSWVVKRFGLSMPVSKTVVFGVSAGAELALAMGILHPDVFGVVLAASPGAGYRPPLELTRSLPRAYLLAGAQEPFFRDNAARWATALRDAGADVTFEQPEGTHGPTLWKGAFARMLEWALLSRD